MTTIVAARVVCPDRVVEPGIVELDGDRIATVAPVRGPVPERTLVPGFVDLQVNGIDDIDVAHASGADWDRLDRLLLDRGVTTWCPTLVTASLDDYDAPLERIAEAAGRDGAGPTVAGAHLEGPFLGAMHGAHPHHLVAPLDLGWLAAMPDVVRVVTLGPEQPDASKATTALVQRGVVVAMGHSAATFEEATAVADAGARLVTHCFNGMPPLHHRAPGLVGAALSDDRLTVSLIADLVHVHPAALTIVLRAKGAGRVALVTDSVAWRAETVGGIEIRFDGTAPRLSDGTLAGSALTMDRAVRNLVRAAGVALPDAVRAASTTPATLLGLDDRGRIAPGARADLVSLDADLEVERVWAAGRLVHD